MTVDAFQGRVVVMDLCASWATACNLNARILDEAARALDGKPVIFLTVLLDDGQLGRVALREYPQALSLAHEVVLAGPALRAAQTALGNTSFVPRLVVLDARGRVRVDNSGGIVGVEGLVEEIRSLL